MVVAVRFPAELTPLEKFDAEEARLDFKLFAQMAWHVIEPGTPLLWNWHLDVICDHLQAVYERRIKRLAITLAPGHAKSSFVSVLFPVWCWINDPYSRWLCASHSLDLAVRDNKYRRDLIESDWFQERYGHLFKLSTGQNIKSFFQNDKRGYCMSVAVRSSATGKRASHLLIDDPNNAMAGRADIEATKDWFGKTWMSRLNDQENGPMIVVGQRLDEDDLIGHILKMGWEHVDLPEEYEPARKGETSLGAYDIRTVEGELLWPEMFPREVLDTLKRALGALHYSAQYQQSPIPPGGYTFKTANERLYTLSPEGDMYMLQTPGGIRPLSIYQCWLLTTSDVAVKETETSAYTVFATWAVTPEHDVLLLDVVRGHWDIPTQKKHGRLAYRQWVCDRYRALYFEDVGYQSALGQDLLTEGIPCLPFHPQGKGDKVMRAAGASIWQEAGKVYFPAYAPWLEDWRKEIYTFPMSDKADQVDTLSMVCMIVRIPEIEELDEETADAISNWQGY